MLLYAAKRGVVAVLVLLLVSFLCFLLLHFAGDPAAALAGRGATAETIEFLRKAYGLDRPFPVQYLDWLGRTLTGDLGESLYYRQSVAPVVFSHLPVTLILGAASLLLALLLAIPLGVVAAMRPRRWVDRLALLIAVAGQTLPSFFLSLLLIMLFSLNWGLLPVSGSSTPAHYVLPTLALTAYALPALMRLTRAGMLDVLASDYIRTARANGLSPFAVVFRHALRNAIIPVVALAAVQLGYLLGGSIVIETVFALEGLGYLAWQSISHQDAPVTLAIVLLLSAFYVGLTLIADLLNAWLDPRLRIAAA